MGPGSAIFICLIGIVALLFAFPRLRERGLQGRYWMLVRALFPSWRFFEELGHVPKLSFRLATSDGVPSGAWQDALGHEPRPWAAFLLNARGNLRMASNSLVEQLVTDLAELPGEADAARFEESVSYELATCLVRSRILELKAASPGAKFQFRIVAAVPGRGETEEGEEILVSSFHEVGHEVGHEAGARGLNGR
jgi:hypothetical protein